jgi:hypothetical protein
LYPPPARPAVTAGSEPGGDVLAAAGVLNGRGGDDDGEQQAERIGGDVLLTAFRPFPVIPVPG